MEEKRSKHIFFRKDGLMFPVKVEDIVSKPKEIAVILHKHISTIYRKLKRGRYMHTNSDLTEEERCNPDEADRKAQENLKAKGAGLKIGNDIALANFLERMIIDNKYSPDAALAKARRTLQNPAFLC